MKERGSKEKVIQAINCYRETILQDFLVETQSLIKQSKPFFESNTNKRLKSSRTVKKFKELLYSIKEDNLEDGLTAFSEFLRTEDDYDEYWELNELFGESLEKISQFSIDYKFMESALRFTKL